MQNLFAAAPLGLGTEQVLGPLDGTGLQPHFLSKLAARGVVLPDGFFLAAADSDQKLRAVGGRA
jgi:hypothetical protein